MKNMWKNQIFHEFLLKKESEFFFEWVYDNFVRLFFKNSNSTRLYLAKDLIISPSKKEKKKYL